MNPSDRIELHIAHAMEGYRSALGLESMPSDFA